MSDYISRQAAIDAASHGCGELRGTFGRCEDEINKVPSADVVEVVRCKDCKHFLEDEEIQENYCELDLFCHLKSDFCNYGERRTDETDYRKE